MTKSVMLGEISARELHGPWSDFMERLQSVNGREWFTEFKRFLRKEPCWVEDKINIDPISSIIVRRIRVDRTRKPKKALEATGRKVYVNNNIVATMPKGEGEEVDVIFFKLDRYISDDDLEKEYAVRGLKPADPYSLAAVNEADPAFADEYPNATHWKNANGQYSYATFDVRLGDERYVHVRRRAVDWRNDWWFAGVRK